MLASTGSPPATCLVGFERRPRVAVIFCDNPAARRQTLRSPARASAAALVAVIFRLRQITRPREGSRMRKIFSTAMTVGILAVGASGCHQAGNDIAGSVCQKAGQLQLSFRNYRGPVQERGEQLPAVDDQRRTIRRRERAQRLRGHDRLRQLQPPASKMCSREVRRPAAAAAPAAAPARAAAPRSGGTIDGSGGSARRQRRQRARRQRRQRRQRQRRRRQRRQRVRRQRRRRGRRQRRPRRPVGLPGPAASPARGRHGWRLCGRPS